MPLMEVTLERGLSGEAKAALRRDLCRDMAELVGLDPTAMASPLISTILDAVSLVIYFNIAVAVLQI